MKKPYQIEGQRAVKRLEQMMEEGDPAVRMVLPMAEAMAWLKQGVGALIQQAGVQLAGADDGAGGAGTGWGAEQAASRSPGPPLGQRGGLLRGDGTEGGDPAAPGEKRGRARSGWGPTGCSTVASR